MRLPELAWPERVLGPPPASQEVRFACLAVLACVILLLVASLTLSPQEADALGLSFEEDFAGFYGVGRLLNEYPPDRLYDFQIQESIYLQLRPRETSLTLPYVHAPFEALLFRPLARLPYRAAYLLWLAVGLAAYALALAVTTSRFGPHHPRERATTFLLAFSFSPFAMESWLGGNVAVVAFLALALAVVLDDAQRPALSGAALSLCLNKPSLLVLVLPMLLVSGRFRTLLGFAGGTAVLVATSALVLGFQTWWNFVVSLLWWADLTRTGEGFFRDWKYVDLNAFSRMLPLGRSWFGVALLTGFALWSIGALLRTWFAGPWSGRQTALLAWATTITWSLVLNAYVPLYDCTLLVLVGILTGAALRHPVHGSLPPALPAVVALCYLSAWFTQPVARLTGVQIYTLVLIYIGLWLTSQQRRSGAATRLRHW